MLDWEWPWLALLLPLPWLLRLVLSPATRQSNPVRVPFFAELASSEEKQHSRTSHWPAVLASLAWAMLLLAAMRPVWFAEPVSITTSARDLMLAVDISDSMKIDDMLDEGVYVTRMHSIKTVVGDFIQRRPSDRIGLILFGQRSYVITPLTLDHQTVSIQLQEALPGFAGSSTAIGDAIGLAISTLRDRPAQSRVLILLTDGSNTAGSDPVEALRIATEAGIRIHTVGVGADKKDYTDAAGRRRTIDPSRDLDEESLTNIAVTTGGQYFRAHNPEEMQSIYSTLDKLEPQPDAITIRPQRSLYHWPLAAAVMLSLLIMWLHGREPRYSQHQANTISHQSKVRDERI